MGIIQLSSVEERFRPPEPIPVWRSLARLARARQRRVPSWRQVQAVARRG